MWGREEGVMFLAEETVSPKALRLLVRTLAYEGVCIHE